MAKLTLSDVTTGNGSSLVSTINANSLATETALENTLSRDGTSPNEMNADFDMNSNRILNLPEPSSGQEPLRLQDYNTLLSGGTVTAGAPTNAQYLTLATNTSLSLERVLTAGAGVTFTDAGAGSTLTIANDMPVLFASDYGLSSSNTADQNDTALAALATAIGTGGKTVIFPQGTFTFDSSWNISSLKKVRFVGAGGINLSYNSSGGTVFLFTGTGTGSAINMTDHRSVWWEDIQFIYNDDLFTGIYHNASTSFSTGCGSGFIRCQWNQVTDSGCTATGVYLKNNVDVTFINCYWAHCNPALLGLFDADTGETNMIKLYSCTFIANQTAITNPHTGWSLYGCNFEPVLITNAPSSVQTTGSHDVTNFSMFGCVFADSMANGTWVNFAASDVFNFVMVGGAILSISGTVNGIVLGEDFSSGIYIHGVLLSGVTTCFNFQSAPITAISITGCPTFAITTFATGLSGIDDQSVFDSNGTQTGNRRGTLKLIDGIAAPTTESGGALIYVDTADGDLKVKFGDGTVKTLATDT